MYIALENNDRYRILMYEKSPQDWTEEDEDFVAETYQNYFNANIPKVDDVIQSFIFHLEGKNFTPEMKNQYKENFTYQVTQIYESFFQTTLSYNSNKTALDMIKKYPKRALLVNEYFENEISKTVPDGEDGMKIVNSLLEVLENGYQNVFENIQIKDIQAKPSLFHKKYYLHYTITRLLKE